jgi:hypothetical protein
MKRSPLKRKTPLRPGKSRLKRTRLRRKSNKQARIDYANKPLHDAYRKEFPLCQCGCGRVATDIHELRGGSYRQTFRSHRWGILHLARRCHERIQYWALVRQLALKWWSNSGYDYLAVKAVLKGRTPSLAAIDAEMPS